jgi:Fic family protein
MLRSKVGGRGSAKYVTRDPECMGFSIHMDFKPQFTITNGITASLTRIERARGFLDAAKLSEDWIAEMQDRALVLEAHHTTHIEGTELTLEQAERILAGKKVRGARPDDTQELLNYKKAFELVSEYLDSGEPITEALIRQIHKRLVQSVRGNKASPGEYRKIQNYIVNTRTGEKTYTPPPPIEVPHMTTDLVAWLQGETQINPVIVAGIAQFQLVHIHPFVDGNGRTARLLSTLCLYKAGYDFKRLFTISEYYDRDRPAYYKALQSVRERAMDMTGWLEYFSEGLNAQMLEVQVTAEHVMRKDVILARARKNGLKERPAALLGYLLTAGKATVAECEEELKINRRTLQRDLKLLVEKGLVREIGTGPTDPTKYYQPLL